MTFPEIMQKRQSDFIPRTPILLLRPSKRSITQQSIDEQITTYCEDNSIKLAIMTFEYLENVDNWSTRQPMRGNAEAFYTILEWLNNHPDDTVMIRLKLDDCSWPVGKAVYNVLINRQLYDRPFPDNLIVIAEFKHMNIANDIFDVKENEIDLLNHFYIVNSDYYGDPMAKCGFSEFTGFKQYVPKRRIT